MVPILKTSDFILRNFQSVISIKNITFYPQKFFLACLTIFFLVSCDGQNVDPMIQKAIDEWIKGRNHHAIELFKAILKQHSSGPVAEEALFRLGEIYHFSLGDSAKGILYFQEVLQLNKESVFGFDAQRYIAEIVEFTFKDLDQAIIEYQHLINDFNRPMENGDHQYRIASIYYKKQNYEQALTELEILIDSYPESRWAEETNFKIVEILFTLNQCSGVHDKYDRFIINYPDSRFKNELDFVIASCLEEEDKLKEAYDRFQSLRNRYAYPALLKMKIEGIKKRMGKKP